MASRKVARMSTKTCVPKIKTRDIWNSSKCFLLIGVDGSD